jgi:membrane-bound lytic murein transglycosylase MltF
MRKKFAQLPGLVVATLVCLLAVSGAQPSAQPPNKSPDARLSLDPAFFQSPWTGDLDGMLNRRLVRILTVNSKTQFFADGGVLRGTVVDFAHVLEDYLNTRLSADRNRKNPNVKLRIVFIPMRRDQLLPALLAGKGDIAAANLTITPERLKLVAFSAAGLTNVSEVVVTGPESPKIASLDDLSGKQVFARRSSSYFESLIALNKRFVTENKPPVVIRPAPETLEDEDLIQMVNAGLVPVIIVDRHIADFWKQIFPHIDVHEDVIVRNDGEIAWAIRKNSPQLKAELDYMASRNKVGTANGNAILKRYLKSVKYVTNAVSDSERRKFELLKQFFQKFGARYDVDWLLMEAQGYQESQLNQNAKSRVGAIGIMQIMPATGRQMNVGDIHQTEANIDAAIKYMRFVINNYYSNEPITRLNKALFTFASYNAGAARVEQLRREAKRRGMDPNVWFGNVEYVAGEKIGQETVTYVSNIYKYYLAYRLTLENKEAAREAVEKIKANFH